MLDRFGEVFEQFDLPLLELGQGEIFLVADDGVFPADQSVTILERQAVEVEEHLKGVQPREICHRLALAPAGEGRDHVGGVAL